MKYLKHLLLILILGLTVVAARAADSGETPSGCGSPQSGTTDSATNPNCGEDALLSYQKKLSAFVQENLNNLANDIANGRGEYLVRLADLMEIPIDQRAGFYQNLQSHYRTIFSRNNLAANNGVVDSIIAVTLAN